MREIHELTKEEKEIVKEAYRQLDEYLDSNIYKDLTNINDGLDEPYYKYFSESEFTIVLERVKNLGLSILGIESFINGMYFFTANFEDYAMGNDPADSNWYMEALEDIKSMKATSKYCNEPLQLGGSLQTKKLEEVLYKFDLVK